MRLKYFVLLFIILLFPTLFLGQGITYPINVGNNFTPWGPSIYPNMTPVQIYSMNLSTGDHALYTVPTGRKAFITVTVHNISGVGAILCTPKVSFDSGSTYKTVNGSTSPANGATSSITWGWIGNAGEIFGLTTATNNGANVFGVAYEFDASSPLKMVSITSFSDGNNTIYTVPAGKKAFLVWGYQAIISASAQSPFIESVTSTSVASVTFNIVQSGGSVASTNRIFNGTVNGVNGPGTFIALNTGDFINLNIPAGQSGNFTFAFTQVVEYTP